MMRTHVTRRARLLTGAAIGAVSLLAFAGGAAAQDAPAQPDPDEATEIDEIVVTGIRAAIQNSIAAKRNNSSIVEVITAEDIGKLPDVSIAESLARLPGLTSQRLDGRSQVISVRGLGPDFTTALLNGREQVSSGDNRGVEFDQYPSELLSGVTVYKTPDASLVGQGLAGTVDLQTVRPLSFGRQALAANYRYELNDKGALNAGTSDHGERYSLSYIDQFADDTIGIALGYAHTGSPYQAEQFRAWGPPYPTNSDGNLVLGGAEFRVMSGDLQRDAFMGVLEWRPNDRSRTIIDAYHSTFDNTQILRGLEAPLFWGGSAQTFDGACTASGNTQTADCRPGPSLRPGFTVEDGLITSGTFDNVKALVQNYEYARETDMSALGFNTQYDLTDRVTLEADISWSKSDRSDELYETLAGTGRNVAGALDSLGFTIQPGEAPRFTATLNYADPNLIVLTSPQGWGGASAPNGQDGYLNSPAIEDELTAINLSAHVDLEGDSAFSRLEIGVYGNERDKSLDNEQYYLVLPNSPGNLRVPDQFLLTPTSLEYVGIAGGVLSYDVSGLVGSGAYNLIPNLDPNVIAGSWAVNEKILTTYVKADIDTNLGSIPVTGNLGVQVVYTDQSSDGFAANGTTVTPVSGGDSYTQLYPSLNLIFEPWENQFVRMAAARTFARPRMDELRASQTYGINSGNVNSTDPTQAYFNGGGGNPELRPWIANVFDISYERYFGRSAYISIAAFYKDLESYIYNQNVLFDFTGYPTNPGETPASFIGQISSPQNGQGGSISGVEFAVSTPFDFIHPWLEGFGGTFSISSTESDIQPNPNDPSQPIPGLSEIVSNVTLYYERNGFQTRVSNRYRSEFTGEVAGFGQSRTFRQIGEESVIDAQIGYQFQSGPLEGLSFLAQVNNLTDEEFTTNVNSDERQTINHQSYGRTFLFGINYRY